MLADAITSGGGSSPSLGWACFVVLAAPAVGFAVAWLLYALDGAWRWWRSGR